MKKYIYIIRNSFKETNKSKLIFLITLFQPLILLYGYILFYSFLTNPGKLSVENSIVTYYIFILVVSSIDLTRYANDIQRRIHDESYLNIDKLPINPFLYYFFVSVGRTLLTFLILLIGSITYLFWTKFDLLGIALFPICTIAAFFLAHLIFFTLTSLTFYQESIHVWLFGITTDFLSGRLIPLQLIPNPIQSILLMLPFSYAFGAIAKNYGNFNTVNLIISLLITIFWSILLFKLGTKLWQKGSYHFQENS